MLQALIGRPPQPPAAVGRQPRAPPVAALEGFRDDRRRPRRSSTQTLAAIAAAIDARSRVGRHGLSRMPRRAVLRAFLGLREILWFSATAA
jgi:hypothetical protein